MEIMLSGKLQSLVAFDTGGSNLDLTKPQVRKIVGVIEKNCSTCGLCIGVGTVTSSGYVYSKNGLIPVPATCPANGTSVTV